MIKITACVIVKNEEKCIGRWLESVAGYADEIIVVDTGSTDRTIELVKAQRAQLYTFPWTGDFSAAKNYALEQATGNWIVFLDADEYFSPATVKNIRSVLTELHPQKNICGVMCRLVNIDTEQNNKFIGATVQVRIFRNTSKLRYYGRVHEALTIPRDKSVELVKEIEIIHTGYTASIVRKKIERNLQLLQEKIQDNGGKITPRDYRYLVDCYYGLGEYEQALGYAEKALQQAEAIKDAKDHIYMMKVSSCLFGEKDYQTVVAAFDEAIEACPQVADFWVMKGLYLHDQKNYLEAEQCIQKGLQQHEQYKLTPDGVANNLERFLPNAYMVLGRIQEMKGKRAEAEQLFIRGLEVQRYQPRLLRELVQSLRADKLPDDDIIVVLNHIYDKKKDARFLADTLRDYLGQAIYLYYLHQCEDKTFADESAGFLAAKRYDAASLAAAERLDWLYRKGIEAAVTLQLPQDSTLQVLLPEHYRQQWQERAEGQREAAKPEKKGQAKQRKFLAKQFKKMQQAYQNSNWGQVVGLAEVFAGQEDYLPEIADMVGMAHLNLLNWEKASFWLQLTDKRKKKNPADYYWLLGMAESKQNHYVKACEFFTLAEKHQDSYTGELRQAFLADLWTQHAAAQLVCGECKEAAMNYHRASQAAVTLRDKCQMYASWLMTRHNWDEPWQALVKDSLVFNEVLKVAVPYTHEAHPSHKKLRIGYISPDFRHNVMFYFAYQLLAGHTRQEFTIYAYYCGYIHDGYTEDIRRAVDEWQVVADLTYEEIAKRIYADEIDILVDLAGHSAHSGLPVLAWKPAPIQISGLGYMSTTGLQTVDYLLTDEACDPPAAPLQLTEKPLYLSSLFCYTGRSDVPQSQGAPCRQKGYITFGVFNRYQKVTDEMLLAWKDILAAVPTSRILFKGEAYEDDLLRQRIVNRLEVLGFTLERVIFENASADYMERYLDVDIALDTYPYTGGGTTCDALYMGVPVVARYGESRGSRFALSVLTAVELEDLAVETVAAYCEKAIALAKDEVLLDALHKNLRNIMLQSRLMDTVHYVAEVEAAYRNIWTHYTDGEENAIGLHRHG